MSSTLIQFEKLTASDAREICGKRNATMYVGVRVGETAAAGAIFSSNGEYRFDVTTISYDPPLVGEMESVHYAAHDALEERASSAIGALTLNCTTNR